MTTATDSNPALMEAVEWTLRLAEAPDDAEVATQFEAWRTASADNAEAWRIMSRASAALAGVETPPVRDRGLSRHWGAAITAMAAALLLGLVVLPGQLRTFGADHVAKATMREVVLEDGSRVQLAPGSAVDVDFADGQRRVRLRGGEAMFEVTRDPARPFVVTAGGAETTVLGTGFDVRRAGDGAEVAVRHGRVRVAMDGKAVVLEAGDRARASGEGVTRDHIGAELVALWTQGRIVALDRPLGETTADLDRHFSGRIVVDPRLRARHLTGVYDAADPHEAADAVAAAVNGRAIHMGKALILIVSG